MFKGSFGYTKFKGIPEYSLKLKLVDRVRIESKKKKMAKKNNLYINIKDDDSELAILVNFLRDGEISSRSIVALRAFYFSQAISKSSTSTPEDIRKAEHYCLSQLKQQMIYIMDKHYREDGIEMNADEFSTVTINQSPLAYLPNLDRVVSQNEDREVRGEMSICTETYVKAKNVTEQTSQ